MLTDDLANLSFEDAMRELETIVRQLESGKTNLELYLYMALGFLLRASVRRPRQGSQGLSRPYDIHTVVLRVSASLGQLRAARGRPRFGAGRF